MDRDCSRLSRSKNVYSDYLKNVISSYSDPCDVCVLGSVNSGNGQNNGNDLKVNMEELNKYLKIAYEQALLETVREMIKADELKEIAQNLGVLY